MQDGLYKAAFKTPIGEGYGVVTLSGGTLRGGDSMMYYVGTYSESGGQFTASVDVDKHSNVPGMISTFGPGNNNGQSTDDSATAKGSSPQAPGVGFSLVLTRLA